MARADGWRHDGPWASRYSRLDKRFLETFQPISEDCPHEDEKDAEVSVRSGFDINEL
jgi:hypothetical protein